MIYRYTDWTGERKQSQKRGFKTKREALAWEREQLNKATADLDMTFASFVEQYTADMKTRIKENTWATKDHIIRTKLLPYFGKLKMCNITAQQIITWQNEMLDHMMYGVNDTDRLHFATAAGKIGNGLDEQLESFVREHPDTRLIIIDTMQKIREVGGEAYSYASDYEIIGKLKRFADRHSICIVTVHHTRKQPAGDSFETISGTTGLLGCADGALLMQKKKRTALETTVDAVGRDQQDQILYLKKDADTQIWSLERTENEPYQEPPDPVLDTVSQLVSSESREWTGSPTELAEAVNTGMAANALTKYLNVKSGRLLDEYHVRYENRAKHSGRQVKLTYMVIGNVEYEVID